MEELVSKTVYFKQPGKQNTSRVMELAHARATELGLHTVVTATTSGDSGLAAARTFSGMKVIVVSHSTGFRGPNTQELTDENRQGIEELGGTILTTTHAFGGVNRAVRQKLKTYQTDEIIAFTLRIFGEGLKVVCETTLMAADAGLLPVAEPALIIAGTGSGSDTAAIILPAHAQDFFDLRLIELICIPAAHHPLFH